MYVFFFKCYMAANFTPLNSAWTAVVTPTMFWFLAQGRRVEKAEIELYRKL